MPIGYLVTTGLMAAVALSAASRQRPRGSSPIRLSYVFGFLLNWPNVLVLVLVASTALAIAQSGVGSPVFWIGLGLAVLAFVGLMLLRRRALGTSPAVERALADGLGGDWSDGVEPELAARLHQRPPLARILFAPISFRRQRVKRVANLRYGPARRANLLDLYRDHSERSGCPTLIYFHPRFGSKEFAARYMLLRLASEGWVCVSANYRVAGFPDQLVDVKNAIAWLGEHGREYGADMTAVFLAGSSLGAHLASLAAFTPNGVLQPGSGSADTSVAGVICLYGYYGPVASEGPPSSRLAYPTTNAPACFVAHGDQDSLVIVEDARAFVEQLRATSSNPVVYAELPGAQHGFDMFRSRRFDTVVDAIEAFMAHIR